MVKEKDDEEIESWKITFELDNDVKELNSWEAEVEKAGSKKFALTNNGWNGPTAADMVRPNRNCPFSERLLI